MANASMVLTGDKALNRALGRLDLKDQKKAIRKAARFAMRPVLARARSLAPRGTTGLMRKHIKLRALKGGRYFIGVSVRTGTRPEMGIEGNASWYYPAHVELGTKKMAAKPFLRPAFDAKRDLVARRFDLALWKFIKGRWTK